MHSNLSLIVHILIELCWEFSNRFLRFHPCLIQFTEMRIMLFTIVWKVDYRKGDTNLRTFELFWCLLLPLSAACRIDLAPLFVLFRSAINIWLNSWIVLNYDHKYSVWALRRIHDNNIDRTFCSYWLLWVSMSSRCLSTSFVLPFSLSCKQGIFLKTVINSKKKIVNDKKQTWRICIFSLCCSVIRVVSEVKRSSWSLVTSLKIHHRLKNMC